MISTRERTHFNVIFSLLISFKRKKVFVHSNLRGTLFYILCLQVNDVTCRSRCLASSFICLARVKASSSLDVCASVIAFLSLEVLHWSHTWPFPVFVVAVTDHHRQVKSVEHSSQVIGSLRQGGTVPFLNVAVTIENHYSAEKRTSRPIQYLTPISNFTMTYFHGADTFRFMFPLLGRDL